MSECLCTTNPAASKELTGCVISHTHWDREWYLNFQQFRIKLVDLIDRVLQILDEQPEYVFHLDAQTVVLEDYLEIRPHRREQVAQYIRKQRLLVGPWYVQNDFALTSGEATIRNLLIGSAIAADFGHCSRTGYVPDQFGLASQLPQIFRGFGIRDCIFGRGYVIPEGGKTEFTWRAPDGSEVLGILMAYWYNNAQRFSADPTRSMKYTRHILDSASALSASSHLLLMNGVDHLEAQEDLLPILANLRERLEHATIRQTTLDEYSRLLHEDLKEQTLVVHEGEMRQGSDGSILQGTLSSRVYLKVANTCLQVMLENKIEPLYAMLSLAGYASLYPADYLHYLWKELIKNHAHDSICGCSCDAVHEHMEDRFAQIAECGNDLIARGLRMWIERIDRTGLPGDGYLLLLVNTVQQDRTEAITATLRFISGTEHRTFRMRTLEGDPVAFEVVGHQVEAITVLSPINLPGELVVDRYTVRLEPVCVPGLGHRVVIIEQMDGTAPVAVETPSVSGNAVRIANDTLELDVSPSGHTRLRCKSDGRVFDHLFTIEDQGDVGDSYHFRPIAEETPLNLTEAPPRIELLSMSPLEQSVRLTWVSSIPAHADHAENRRSADQVLYTISMDLTLTQGRPWLDVRLRIDNKACDHRTRLLVRTGLEVDSCFTNAPFDFVDRPVTPDARDLRTDRTDPTSGIVGVGPEGAGMAVLTEGLYACAYLGDPEGTLAITLLRATGTISGHTDKSRPSKVWTAPGNQCLRTLDLHLAVMPWAGERSTLSAPLQSFLNPMLTGFDAVNTRLFMGGRHCVQDTEVAELFYRDLAAADQHIPALSQWVRIEGEGVVLSAFKQAEQGRGLVMRLFNPTRTDTTAQLIFAEPVSGITLMQIDETPGETLPCANGTVSVPMPAGHIQTIGIARQ